MVHANSLNGYGMVLDGAAKSSPQKNGTYHSKKQIINASTINYNETIDVKYLIRIKEIEKLI